MVCFTTLPVSDATSILRRMIEWLTKDQSRKYLEISHHCPVGLQYLHLTGLQIISKNLTLDFGVAEVRIGHLPHTNEKLYLSHIARFWYVSLPSIILNVVQSAWCLCSVALLCMPAWRPALYIYLSVCWRCVMNRFHALFWGRHDRVLSCVAL